jgi:diguanylate cyclase (GGDEF)-like protein/PAS domain S-box-containing protein
MNKKKALQVTIGLIVAGLLSTIFLYSQIDQQQHIYKSMLFAAFIVLLVYLGLVLARLQLNSRNLRETLTDLEFRKLALDEHAIVSITDIKGKIIYVNDKFCETSQYARDELIGKNHRIIKSGQHSEPFYREIWETIGNGKIWQGQICNRAKDGSYFWVDSTLIARLNNKGKPFEYIAIHTDITAQKDAEYEIESLARFPMENPEPVMRVNEFGKVIFHNDAAEILLDHWHASQNSKLPNEWVNKIQEILNFNAVQEIELSIGLNQYLLIMTPVIDAGCVNIYGRDISDRKHAEASLSYQKNHDRLTGLVNRYVFEHELDNALAMVRIHNKLHVLLYIDLDQFKIVNDTCGHVAGDELLCQLSNMMLSLFRENDTLARLGGDEFGVLLLNCSEETGNRVAQKLLDMINHYRFTWEGQQFAIGASIGLVEINKDSDSIVSMLGHADVACYAAKDAGRNQIKIYNSEDSESAQRHSELQWASHIPKALAEDRFLLMVQTITPLQADNNLKPHYEILLRMVSEEGDLVSPAVFIPAAERYNLMPAVDHWVVAHVFNFLHDYAHNNGTKDLPVLAINLSGESMGSEELLAYIRAQFELKIIPAANICFEITETAAIGNLNEAISFIKSLKKLGCEFALDDFGSGLSSFSYLKSLPVDYLKIDGVFVKDIVDDPVDAAMVEAINQVGHIMKIKTIAEFVENGEIMDMLRKLGVDYAQGYHIDKPLPLDEKFPVTQQQRGLKKTG